MIRATLISLLLCAGSAAPAADAGGFPEVLKQELHRIDPAKTLLLIKRIKIATGSGLVVS